MKKIIFFLFALAFCTGSLAAAAAEVDPVLSTARLQESIDNPSIAVIDIRRVEEYREGHIPGSMNLTFTAWRTMEGDLGCQLPQKDELSDTVCSIGADRNTHVIIVGKTDRDIDLVSATRVAWTLKYAGIRNISILEGGYDKWVRENRPVAQKATKRARRNMPCEWNDRVLATRKDVSASCAGKAEAAIIDTRPEAQFAGLTTCPGVKRKGTHPGGGKPPLFPRLHKRPDVQGKGGPSGPGVEARRRQQEPGDHRGLLRRPVRLLLVVRPERDTRIQGRENL